MPPASRRQASRAAGALGVRWLGHVAHSLLSTSCLVVSFRARRWLLAGSAWRAHQMEWVILSPGSSNGGFDGEYIRWSVGRSRRGLLLASAATGCRRGVFFNLILPLSAAFPSPAGLHQHVRGLWDTTMGMKRAVSRLLVCVAVCVIIGPQGTHNHGPGVRPSSSLTGPPMRPTCAAHAALDSSPPGLHYVSQARGARLQRRALPHPVWKGCCCWLVAHPWGHHQRKRNFYGQHWLKSAWYYQVVVWWGRMHWS